MTKSLSDFFQMNILATGTPTRYLKALRDAKPDHEIECTFESAIKNNLICKPVLNLVKYFDEEDIPSAVYSMVRNEMAVKARRNESFNIKSLICLTGIDEVRKVMDVLMEKEECRDWNFLAIHSDKSVVEEYQAVTYRSRVNNVDINSKENTFKVLQNIGNDMQPLTDVPDMDVDSVVFDYSKPTLVFQVDMLSEGINFNTFNSVFITKGESVKQAQQIGRVIRDCGTLDHSKIEFGHAYVYFGYILAEDLKDLMWNLRRRKLTAFDWGGKLEVSVASWGDCMDDPEALDIKWNRISDMEIEECRNYMREYDEKHPEERFNSEMRKDVCRLIKECGVDIQALMKAFDSKEKSIASAIKAGEREAKKVTQFKKAVKVSGEEDSDDTYTKVVYAFYSVLGDVRRGYGNMKSFIKEEDRESFILDSLLKRAIPAMKTAEQEDQIYTLFRGIFSTCNLLEDF